MQEDRGLQVQEEEAVQVEEVSAAADARDGAVQASDHGYDKHRRDATPFPYAIPKKSTYTCMIELWA